MQEDMHYYGVYALARAAGIRHDEARLIAHASQFVDDASEDGAIVVEDGARAILPTTTSHKALDVKNAIPGDQWKVWVPFHFIPGCAPGAATFHEKMVCTMDSPMVREILERALADDHPAVRPYRAGIALHAYADTFSHHGFVGLATKANKVVEDSVEVTTKSGGISQYLKRKWDLLKEHVAGTIAEAVPVGHGSVTTYPDRPYLRWRFRYEHHDQDAVQERDNPADYLLALKNIHAFFGRYLAAHPDAGDAGEAARWGDLRPAVNRIIRLEGTLEQRIAAWWEAITSGALFRVTPQDLTAYYDENEWRPTHVDLYTAEAALFYRAAWHHRERVLHDLLPRYGVLLG